MEKFQTEQEAFWAGGFGNDYIERNNNLRIVSGNISLFAHIFKCTRNISSIIEFGANIGLNLIAIKSLLPNAELSAIEINKKAVKKLSSVEGIKVYNESILNFQPDYKRDFAFSKLVLIHIDPDMLQHVYDLLYQTSNKYICIAEYYNPTPLSIPYRGHKNRLFKRDFAGELLDRYTDLKLIDYGFAYRRDNYHEYDDFNWFLLEK